MATPKIGINNSSIVASLISGSKLYGLSTPASDTDYKSVYIPTARDIILGKIKLNKTTSSGSNNSKNTADDVDHEVFSLDTFVKHACTGQIAAIDMLHVDSEHLLVSSPEWEYLVTNRKKFYSKSMDQVLAYIRRQAAKYGIKGSKVANLENIIKISKGYTDNHLTLADIIDQLPINEYSKVEKRVYHDRPDDVFYNINGSLLHDVLSVEKFVQQITRQYDRYGKRALLAKENNGIDWKAVSHCFRAAYQVRDIYKYGDFEYPLKETEFILSVKNGELDFITDVNPVLEALTTELTELSNNSSLPDKVDTEFWDQWLYSVYSNVVIEVNNQSMET